MAITQSKAMEILDDACDLWDEVEEEDVTQEQVNHVAELLDLAGQGIERADWVGAWLWAGTAIAFIRERVIPLPVTA